MIRVKILILIKLITKIKASVFQLFFWRHSIIKNNKNNFYSNSISICCKYSIAIRLPTIISNIDFVLMRRVGILELSTDYLSWDFFWINVIDRKGWLSSESHFSSIRDKNKKETERGVFFSSFYSLLNVFNETCHFF